MLNAGRGSEASLPPAAAGISDRMGAFDRLISINVWVAARNSKSVGWIGDG